VSTIQHPNGDALAEAEPTVEGLLAGYRTVADLFVYPEEVDCEALVKECRTEVVPSVRRHVDETAADHLDAFLDDYENIDVDLYVQMHELDPKCPLYLGHHEFDAPETCRDISDADRNQYMVELNAIYEHFGFGLADELPDFVPAMVEFLWLTIPDRDDGLRDEFMEKFADLLPGMREQFEDAGTPYWQLLAALQGLIEADLALSGECASEDGEADSASGSDGSEPPGMGVDEPVTGGETR